MRWSGVRISGGSPKSTLDECAFSFPTEIKQLILFPCYARRTPFYGLTLRFANKFATSLLRQVRWTRLRISGGSPKSTLDECAFSFPTEIKQSILFPCYARRTPFYGLTLRFANKFAHLAITASPLDSPTNLRWVTKQVKGEPVSDRRRVRHATRGCNYVA